MQTVRMSEDIFMRMYHWMKQNKVDGVRLDSVNDDYIKVNLIKERHALSHMIRVKDFYTDYPFNYSEFLAKELNDGIKKEASK